MIRIGLLAAIAAAVIVGVAGAAPRTVTLGPDVAQTYGTTVVWQITGDEGGGWVVGACVQSGTTILHGPRWFYPYYGYFPATPLRWDIIDTGAGGSCTFRFEDVVGLKCHPGTTYPPPYRCTKRRTMAEVTFALLH